MHYIIASRALTFLVCGGFATSCAVRSRHALGIGVSHRVVNERHGLTSVDAVGADDGDVDVAIDTSSFSTVLIAGDVLAELALLAHSLSVSVSAFCCYSGFDVDDASPFRLCIVFPTVVARCG